MTGFEWKRIINENSLVFCSLDFLFLYLPVFLMLFYLTPRRFRYVTLFVGSILLYACCEPFFVLLLLAVTMLNYLVGKYLGPDRNGDSSNGIRRGWLIMITAVNIGVLAFFKIGNVLNQNLLLPLGISFYSFKMLSYQFDVYRGKIRVEKNFLKLGAYLCLFPQITSGPIMRYEEAYEGLSGRKIFPEDVEEGMRLMVIGLSAKVLLADRIGILWNDIQTIGFESISTPLAWFGAFGYSLQLYFDFLGYSLMAAGIGMMLGLPFIKNFDHPYMSASVSEFWRRWHMTLGSWFRDYVYIPLGGNRKSIVRTVLNLAFVWILTGLWHGNSVNFLIWGLALGFFVIAEKLFYGRWLSKHAFLSRVYLLFVIPLTWMIFAIGDTAQLGIYFGRLFPFFGIGETLNSQDVFQYAKNYGILMLAALVFCVPRIAELYGRWKRKWFVNVFLVILFWAAVYRITNAVNNPFMYFRF